MEILLTSIHVLAAFVLVTVVLLQHGKGADIGATFGGGSSQTVFGSRGAGNFLTKMTTLFVVLFMGTSISLAYLGTPQSVFDDLEVPEAAPAGTGETNPDATPIDGSGELDDPNAIPGFEAIPTPEEDGEPAAPGTPSSSPEGSTAPSAGGTDTPSEDGDTSGATAPRDEAPAAPESAAPSGGSQAPAADERTPSDAPAGASSPAPSGSGPGAN